MNIFHKVTLQSLKQNKTRTVVTIIGILLSASMISAVTTLTASIQNYGIRSTIYTFGDWHGSEENTDYSVYETIVSSEQVEQAAYLQQIGHARIQEIQNEYKPYLYVVGASEGAEHMLPIHITSGRYPTSVDEILLPEHLASNGGVCYSIGDTLTLEIGTRTYDGATIDPQAPIYVYDETEDTQEALVYSETLKIREIRTYKVVGFYSRFPGLIEDFSSPGYMAVTIADADKSADYSYTVYFKLKHAKDIYDFMDEHGYSGKRNTDFLLYQGLSRYDNYTAMLFSLAAIVIGLIMFGSVSLIYNAFAISVSERTRQFGLLSSVGATRRQLRKMVFFEAVSVAVVGIPLGIAAGIAGIGITLELIGSRFMSLLGNDNVSIQLYISWESILIAAALTWITVLISAWIPSKRATKVSAVEAIRQTMDIKNAKPVKTSKLTYKLFGLSGMLAGRYYKRSHKKYRATIMSLFMSIVLFVSASAFTDYLSESVGGGLGTNTYDLYYHAYVNESTPENQSPDNMLSLFQSEENITQVTYVMDTMIHCMISEQYLADTQEKTNDSYVENYVCLFFIPDEEFKLLLNQYGLNETTFMNPVHPLAISRDVSTSFDTTKQKFVTTDLLEADTFEVTCTIPAQPDIDYDSMDRYTDEDGNLFYTFPLYSGKTIEDCPYYMANDIPYLQMIYPISTYEALIPEPMRTAYNDYTFYMTSDNHTKSYENLIQTFRKNGISVNGLVDYAALIEEDRNMVLIIQVFSYGFIVLISLIAAANVFNTISTNISLRRREFAMLKSVGMTERGFHKMMNYECLLYGSKALLFGLPISCGITYLIYLAVMEGYEITFHLPWSAIGIAVLSVFLVVFVTIVYSMRKIQKDNPIDALKNENL